MDAVISEGGVGRKFDPIVKLKVNNTGDGTSLWVADDAVVVGDINVSNNGVYPAVLDELYAYNEVTVDVSVDITDPSQDGSVTGTDPDTGNDYEYGLDGDGNLDVSLLPSAIHIVVKPRKLKYEDGEIIDYTGIHVYLMDGNNRRYTDKQYPTGEIPFGELIFPETIADESKGSDTRKASSNLVTSPLTQPIPFGSQIKQVGEFNSGGKRWKYTHTESGAEAAICYGGKNFVYLIASSEHATIYRKSVSEPIDGGDKTESESESATTQTYTYAGKTVHFLEGSSAFADLRLESLFPTVEANFYDSQYVPQIAWTLIYGDITEAGQEIPVQWMRSDGEVLEDTFKIEVGEGGEPGPPEPDPYDGVYDFEWQGHKYNFNRSLEPDEVHYSNGTVWQEWLGGQSPPYTVPQAVTMGLVIQVG